MVMMQRKKANRLSFFMLRSKFCAMLLMIKALLFFKCAVSKYQEIIIKEDMIKCIIETQGSKTV